MDSGDSAQRSHNNGKEIVYSIPRGESLILPELRSTWGHGHTIGASGDKTAGGGVRGE